MNIEERVSKTTEGLKKLSIIDKAFSILDSLPKYLKYHIKSHTEDVFHEAILFSILDNLEKEKLIAISIAAAWHDVGYLIQPEDNEVEAIKLFKEESKNINNIGKRNIENMIMDTKIHITDKGPEIFMTNPMSAYLLDADVSNFGRKDFRDKLELIAAEKKVNMNDPREKLELLKFTLSLLKNHQWHTTAAQKLRQEQKLINIENLEIEITILENKI